MKHLGVKWRNSLLFIIIVALISAAACALWTTVFEPELYLSRYVFTAGGDSDRIARDCRALLRNDGFRGDILAESDSDGKTLVWVKGPNHGSYISICVLGTNRIAVEKLVQTAGQRLVDKARGLLGAASARSVAPVNTEIVEKHPAFRIAAAAAAGLLLASLAAFLFGSPERSANESADSGKFAVLEHGILKLGKDRCIGAEKAAQASSAVRKTVLKLGAAQKHEGAGIYSLTGTKPEHIRAAASVFAAASALQGNRVLLIESRADASESFVSGTITLQDYLEGRTELNGLLCRTALNGLFYVNADKGAFEGTAVGNGFLRFVSGASQHFDSIFIALPPDRNEETYSAAVSLGGEVLLLIRNGECPENQVQELADDFKLLCGTVRKIYLK